MSDSIDQRIVEMSFENHKFEKGILESKKSLTDFSNVLKKSTKGNDFSGLEKTVGSMSGSFSAFQQVAVGALRQIGAQAVNTGAQLLNSLTLAPITQGFNEMELKMNSTQTIMASTGESLAVVNKYLEELNEYSDKTIYSFSDMTSNIGKFTNAGVKLEDAVASIKGISNAAALAGANSNEASRAMYNFAQALSAGYVKLIDWKSIELANMATVEFKQQLLDSAVAAGTLAKTADGMYKVLSKDMAGKTMDQAISATRNFNDSLSFQWMTTDALTKTLGDYADETTEIGKRAAQAATQVTTFTKLMETLKEAVGSGWARTFEVIFGDFNEARDLWTGVNDAVSAMIGDTSDSRNNFLSGSLSSGWKLFMQEGVADAEEFGNKLAIVAGEAGLDIDEMVKSAGNMEKAVKGAWVTGDMLTESVSRMADEIEGLSDEELANTKYTKKTRDELLKLRDALKSGSISAEDFAKRMGGLSGRENIIQGLKNSVVALLTVLKPISQAFDQIFPPMTVNKFFTMTQAFEAFTKQLIISEDTADKIKRTFAGVFAVFDIGWQVVKLLANSAFEVVKAFLPLGDGVLSATASFGDFLVALNHIIKSTGVFQYGLLGVKVAMAIVRDILANLVHGVMEFVNGLWNAEDPIAYLTTAGQKAFSGLLNIVKMVTTWVSSKFNKAISAASNLINSDIGGSATGVFGTILSVIKEIVSFLGDGAVTAFEYLSDAMKDLDFGKIAAFVTGGILLLFIKQLSDLTGAMAGFTNSVTGVINKIAKKFFTPKTGNTIHDIAVAIAVLAASIWLLSTIPAEDLSRGLTGLAAAVGLFVAAYAGIAAVNVIASKVMKDQEMISSGFKLVGIAAALAIMAGAIMTISKIDKTRVMGSVGILGVMLGFIVAYQAMMALVSKIPGQTKATTNLMGMSAGLLAMVGTIVVLSKISQGDINNGTEKMAGILIVLSAIQVFFTLAARAGGGNKASTNILSMALGILAMVGVLQLLSMIDAGLINRGLPNLLKMTLIIAGINAVMGLAARIGGGKKAKTNLLAVSLTMAAMVGLVALISMISQEDMDKGLVSLVAMAGIITGIELLTATAALIGGGNKVQKTLGSVTLAMVAFTGIIALLAEMEQSEINKGLLTITAMAGIIGAIEVLTALSSKIGGTGKTFGPMISVITGLLALTAVLMLLTLVDQDALLNSSKTIAIASVAMLVLSIAMSKIMSAIKSMARNSRGMAENVKALVPGLLAMGAILGATLLFFGVLKTVLPVLESVSLEKFGLFTAALGLMSALMIAFTLLPTGRGDFVKSLLGLIPGFAAMAAVLLGTLGFFGAMALVMPIVESMSWGSLGKFSAGLVLMSGLLVLFAALAVPLSAAGAIGAPMLAGVAVSLGALALVIAAFTGIAAAMSFVDFDMLSAGFDALTLVGEGIGRFVGAIIGGIAMEGLAGIGEGLAGFASALGQFTPEDLEGVKNMAEAFLIITAGALLDGIASFVTGKSSVDVFAEQLKKMIEAFNTITVADANGASAVLAAMGPMAANLKTFAEAAKEIPNSGGFIGAFMGENDIGTFGGMLAEFVSAFAVLSIESANKAAGVLNAMTPMAENLKLFASVATGIPNSGGFIGDFMGENDIDTFGLMLAGFINAISSIDEGDALKSIAILGSMTPMAANLKTFANAAQSIPNSGGFIGMFMGENDIDVFGTQLAALIDVFSVIDQQSVNFAASILTTMSTRMLPALTGFSEFSSGLKNSGGLAQFFTGNTTLAEFGAEFVRFVNALGGADYAIVQPAMDALSAVADTVGGPLTTEFAGAFTELFKSVTNKSKDYEKDFKALGNNIIEGLKTGINDRKPVAVTAITNVMSAVTAEANRVVDAHSPSRVFEKLGNNVVDGLKLGITNRESAAVASVSKVMKSVVSAAKKAVDAHSPSRVFETIGGWCTKGLADGLTKETNSATTAATGVAQNTEEAIRNALGVHSLSEKFAEIGGWIPESIGSGIQNGKSWLTDKAKSLGIDTGNMTVNGITDSLAGSDGIVTTGINSLIDALTGKPVSDAAGGAGKSVGNSVTKGAQSALSNGSTGLGGTGTQGVIKTELDKLKAVIEEADFYGLITLKGELEMYEKLRASYAEGSEERKAIDREVYTRLKTIYDTEKAYIDDVTEAQREASEERKKIQDEYTTETADAKKEADKKLSELNKKYDEDMVSAKDAANKKLLDADKTYYEGLAKLLDTAEADRKRQREQYAKDQASINSKLLSDIDAQNKAYESAVKSRADAISGSYGLFDKVEKPEEEVKGEDLLENLRDQGAALSDWKQQLEALKGRGVGDALIEELQAMGPKSTAQIKALLSLTDTQLDEYVGLFKGKYTFARVEAEKELVGLKDDTSQAIKDLTAQAGKDLDDLEEEFRNSMAEIDSGMAEDMAELKTTHSESLAEINADLKDKLHDLTSAWEESTTEVNQNLQEKLTELETTYNTSMEKVKTDLGKNLDEMKSKYSTTLKEIKGLSESELRTLIADNKTKLAELNLSTEEGLVPVKKAFDTSGKSILQIFGQSMSSINSDTKSKLGVIATTVANVILSARPSFVRSGENVAEGFAEGINSKAYLVRIAAAALALIASESTQNTLQERSPSKLFHGFGKFVSLGFANGITDYANKAEIAGAALADGPIAAVSSAMAQLTEDMEDGAWSPTITPILDLSNMNSSNLAGALSLSTGLGDVSSRLARDSVQNGSNTPTGPTQIINQITMPGMVVRSDADIDMLMTKLQQKQDAALRGKGIRTLRK